MNLLGSALYDPAVAVTKNTTAALAMTALDTTNLRLAITVPAHGKVRFKLHGVIHGATTFPSILLGVMNGATVIGRIAPTQTLGNTAVATALLSVVAEFTVTGLTPGAMNVDAAYGVETLVAATGIKYGGPNNTTANDAFGGFLFEAWDPQPLKLALDGGVNVTQFGGTAGTFAAGRPEVNTTHAAGTAWGSGAITAASIAADAITAAKIADNAIDAASIATGAITSAKFAAGAIDAAAIADGAIDAATFAASAITATVLAADCITAAKVADGTIDAATFAAGAINAAAIAADAITDAKVAADVTIASVTGAVGSVTGAVGSVTGAVGSVTAAVTVGAISNNVITAASIAADAGAELADAVWDEVLAGHVGVGSAGLALASAGALGTPLDAAGVRAAIGLAAANLDTQLAAIASYIDTEVAAILAAVGTLTAAERNAIADAVLGRNVAGGSSAGRTVKEAFAFMRNKWTLVANTLTVYDTDDTTVLWTSTVARSAGDPVSSSDPA